MNGVCNNRHPPNGGVEGFGDSPENGPTLHKKTKIQKKFYIMLLGLIPFLILSCHLLLVLFLRNDKRIREKSRMIHLH